MGKINIHAGDFKQGKGSSFMMGHFMLLDKANWSGIGAEKIPISDVVSVELASEENVKKLGGTVGWGVTGAVLLGPVGLLAGLLAGGRKKEVTFIAVFHDKRKILATTDAKTYTAITAARF